MRAPTDEELIAALVCDDCEAKPGRAIIDSQDRWVLSLCKDCYPQNECTCNTCQQLADFEADDR